MPCRLENLEKDTKKLVKLINDRRAPGLSPVVADLGWIQRGPLTAPNRFNKSVTEPDPLPDLAEAEGRHVPKFELCGPRCCDYARIYYALDFQLLKYQATLRPPEPAGERTAHALR